MWDPDASSEHGSSRDRDAPVSFGGREHEYVALGRSLRGYDRTETDQLLADMAIRYEELWRDRAGLQTRVDDMTAEAARHGELERHLRETLDSLQQAADEITARKAPGYDSLLDEARAQVLELLGAADAERQRAEARVRRLQDLEQDFRDAYRGVLVTALERLESADGAPGDDLTRLDRFAPSAVPSREQRSPSRSGSSGERRATSKLLDEIRARLKLDDARTRQPRGGS